MSNPTCGRCASSTGVEDPEGCWFCHADLCDDCWETYGHCGHPEADEANRRGREVGSTKAYEELVIAGEMASKGEIIVAETVDPKYRQ